MSDDAQQILLTALARQYGEAVSSARDAAAAIPASLWQGVGIPRPDPAACGRWLRARRGSGLTGRPDRTGIVRWRLRGPTAPGAALHAPGSAASTSAPPLAQQPPQPAPPATTAATAPPPATTVPLAVTAPPATTAPPAQQPWWHPPATTAAPGLPGPRWGCTAWWSPDVEAAP